MRVLIIEDEARIARRIERMTRDFYRESLEEISACDSLVQGLDFLQENKIDLLLLDLNLNGEDGFTVLKTIVSEPFHTIVISAYTEKAITAYEYGVLDFVPKPFDEKRVFQALTRASASRAEERSARFLAVKKARQVLLIDVTEVLYIKGAGIYTELHLRNGKREIHEKSLDKLEQLLPASFQRIHKSYLVATGEARELIVSSGSRYSLVLKNGDCLPIGRTKYKMLRQRLFDRL
ncbi:MAG TPA: LytTR family DNA-binding domain-containing protein [Chitinophagaceae bacterium]|jgi:DNA-binding LytR/AlgR family response regulator|nr:LytTR family DNA-binding domain-containing protein [Chitinophagaceae bacterium]